MSETRNTAPGMRPRSLEARIHDHYARLPESERKVADLILDFPGEIAAYSATELAQLAGVSKAAASRLFRHLGFDSFEEARRLARDAKQWGSPLYLFTKNGAASTAEVELHISLTDNMTALTRAFEQVSPDDVDAIAERIVRAERLWLLGFRNSYFVAAYARWQFIQFRSNVRLLPHPGETLAEYLSEFTPRDLLFVVGFRRRVAALRTVMKTVSGKKTPIVYLTDPTEKTAKHVATWTLICETSTTSLFDTYVGPIGLIHLLSSMAMKKAGKTGRKKLEAIELDHEALSEFD